MQAELIKKSNNEMSFVIKDINPIIANTLRRIIVVEVPVLAIEEVNFLKNDSALYDEIIAHRLGLVPLKTDLKSYELKVSCSCKGKGCAKCQLNLNLKTKGPCTVYSSDIQSSDPRVKVVFDKMPITILLKGQKLEFEATATLGQGKDHAKFSPGICYYRSYPNIAIDQSKCKKCKTCVSVCPKNILFLEGDKVKIKNIIECDLCNACVENCENKAIKIEGRDTDFIFYLESFGQLSPKEILEESTKVFDNKLNEFLKKFKGTGESKISKIKKITGKIRKKKV